MSLKHFLFLLLCLRPAFLPAQAQQAAGSEQVRPIDAAQWAKATEKLDYSKDLADAPKPPRSSPNWNPNFEAWGKVMQVLAVLIAICLIAYAIYQMLNTPRSRAIARDGVEITVDNVEQYIHETDLNRFLQEALAQQNYPLAIRLYYLQTIKNLSEKKAIDWSREKTNRDYLRELSAHHHAPAFRQATLVYERVWYGNQALDAAQFKDLEPALQQLVATTA